MWSSAAVVRLFQGSACYNEWLFELLNLLKVIFLPQLACKKILPSTQNIRDTGYVPDVKKLKYTETLNKS